MQTTFAIANGNIRYEVKDMPVAEKYLLGHKTECIVFKRAHTHTEMQRGTYPQNDKSIFF